VNKYFRKAKEHEVQMAAEEKLLSHFLWLLSSISMVTALQQQL